MVWAVIAFVLLVGYFLGWAVAIWGAEVDDDASIRQFRAYRDSMDRDR